MRFHNGIPAPGTDVIMFLNMGPREGQHVFRLKNWIHGVDLAKASSFAESVKLPPDFRVFSPACAWGHPSPETQQAACNALMLACRDQAHARRAAAGFAFAPTFAVKYLIDGNLFHKSHWIATREIQQFIDEHRQLNTSNYTDAYQKFRDEEARVTKLIAEREERRAKKQARKESRMKTKNADKFKTEMPTDIDWLRPQTYNRSKTPETKFLVNWGKFPVLDEAVKWYYAHGIQSGLAARLLGFPVQPIRQRIQKLKTAKEMPDKRRPDPKMVIQLTNRAEELEEERYRGYQPIWDAQILLELETRYGPRDVYRRKKNGKSPEPAPEPAPEPEKPTKTTITNGRQINGNHTEEPRMIIPNELPAGGIDRSGNAPTFKCPAKCVQILDNILDISTALLDHLPVEEQGTYMDLLMNIEAFKGEFDEAAKVSALKTMSREELEAMLLAKM